MSRLRPRVSILTALLLTTIVGLSIVVALLWREVEPLRQEVRRLRDEVGQLSVDDPRKLHAIQVDTEDELTWKWRVWIPEKHSYAIRYVGESIPKEGFPQDCGTVWVREAGEHVISYRIRRDPRNGAWYGGLVAGSSGVGKDRQEWVEWPSHTSTGGGVGRTTRSFDASQRFELIRKRISQVKSSDHIEDPAAGFLIWIEPSN